MKKFLKYFSTVFIMGLFLTPVSHAQTQTIAIAQLDSCMAAEPKPVLLLLSTDWCKYCQMQKNQIRKNKDFQHAGDQFYYVPFDAESKEKVSLRGQEYSFKPTGVSTGVHELALVLNGSKQLSFPTWVVLDKDYQLLFRHQGVLSNKQLSEVIKIIKKADD
ncbi:thioredoxin family protein [Sphingobacterium sp. SGG-5]|uniref:thioredoxin family protein n=1 Tax=Sphingobacterium sp. SGG-5 TaxID=2710881 RepID=UPI0013ED21EB|nr:thioredoxin family protein [Sphingobacterium sp. SGG-5]NGM60592.1 thioredoxin family protein [Sphingobacterium sp. SGG-5]